MPIGLAVGFAAAAAEPSELYFKGDIGVSFGTGDATGRNDSLAVSNSGASGRSSQMQRGIAERYRGRDSMIVAYPIGEESSRADGLAHLRRL